MAYYFSPSRHHPLVPKSFTDNVKQQGERSGDGRVSSYSSELLTTTVSSNRSHLEEDQEWVVFSPEYDSSGIGEGKEDEEDEDEIFDGVETPLAFPSHNGVGSFYSDDVNDRITAWRLDQSQLVFQEMQRLERQRNQQTISTSDSIMASWGVPDEERHPTKEEHKREGVRGFWNKVTRKVMRDFMGLEDEVLEVIFGETYIGKKEQDDDENSRYMHFNQSLEAAGDWDKQFIERMFEELNIPRASTNLILQYLGQLFINKHDPESLEILGSQLLTTYLSSPLMDHPTLSSNYWDHHSSMYTLSSTEVW